MQFSDSGSGHALDRRALLSGALGAGMVAATGISLAGCSSAEAKPLTVGGLAVTCNLTLPIACAANAAAKGASEDKAKYAFEYSKYTSWPEVKESLMSGEIQAAYMLAPLVMDLADKGGMFKDGAFDMEGIKTVLALRSKYSEAKKELGDPAKYIDTSYLKKAQAR